MRKAAGAGSWSSAGVMCLQVSLRDHFSTSPLLVWADLFEVTVASPVVIDRQERVTFVEAVPDSAQSIWRSCCLVSHRILM